MKDFWRRAKPFVLGALCIMLALYFSPLSILLGYALATHDLAPLWARLLDPGMRLITVICGVALAFAAGSIAVGAAIQAYREREALAPMFYYALLFCVIYLLGYLCYPGLGFAWPLRRAGLEKSAVRARPLVAAIGKFQREKKRAPHNLQELVPRYLPAIPSTGMAVYPKFEYSTREQKGARAKFQSYQLQVVTSAGLLKLDTFYYWPEGDYPARMSGERVERIGTWAYLHD